jgi:hypothetical protein
MIVNVYPGRGIEVDSTPEKCGKQIPEISFPEEIRQSVSIRAIDSRTNS